jgi:hypothetical protein
MRLMSSSIDAKFARRKILSTPDPDPDIERIKEMLRSVARAKELRLKQLAREEKNKIDYNNNVMPDEQINVDSAYEFIENPDLNNTHIKSNSHYSWLIHENKRSLYYAFSSGYVYRCNKEDIKPAGGVPPSKWVRLRPKLKNSTWCVQIDHKYYPLKQIIAKSFTRAWQPNYRIYFKDMDEKNCNVNNLIIKQYSIEQNKGRHRAIEFLIDGEWKEFKSIKEAARALYVSVSTMKRFIYGWYADPTNDKRILNGYEFRFVREKPDKPEEKPGQ